MKELQIFLFALWLVLGTVILISGNITRIMYGYVWLCYLMELLKEIFDNDDDFSGFA